MKSSIISKLAMVVAAVCLTAGTTAAIADEHSQSSQSSQSSTEPNGDVTKVPDGGATALLVGLGLGAVALASRKKR